MIVEGCAVLVNPFDRFVVYIYGNGYDEIVDGDDINTLS